MELRGKLAKLCALKVKKFDEIKVLVSCKRVIKILSIKINTLNRSPKTCTLRKERAGGKA